VNVLKIIILMVVGGFSCAVAQATPTLSNAGIMATTGTNDCRFRLSGLCRAVGSSATADGYAATGPRIHDANSASSSLFDPLRGAAWSEGHVNADSYLPELHAYASSNGSYSPNLGNIDPTVYTGQWSATADATIWAVQGYQYDGELPFDLTVTATLNSFFSASGENGNRGHSYLRFAIFDAANFVFSYTYDDLCPIEGNPSGCGQSVYASASKALYDTGSVSATLHHLVNSGDRFYVGALIDANVCCGQLVDSSHTLQMQFNDFSRLSSFAVAGVAAPVLVPEPASMLLTLTGLGLLATRARRRAHNGGLL
jgi:hypothetical protein